VVEVPTRAVKTPEAAKAPAEKPRDARLGEATKAVDEAIEGGRLVPPDEKNALEALAVLRREFPSAAGTVAAEERLVTALRHEAERHMAQGDFAEAKNDLLQARTLKPGDRDVEALLKIAEAGIVRQGPRVGTPGEPEAEGAPSDLSLAAARHRIDPFRQPGRKVTKQDFEFARNAALEALKQKPGKPEAQVLATFAAGAIAYLDGDDAAAARALQDVAATATRNAGQTLRGLGLFLRRPEAAPAAPSAWEMALAYGDPRGEAEKLIEKELARSPKDAKLLLGRAQLRRLQGRNEDAAAEAKKAFEAANAPLLSAAAADYLAEASVRKGDLDEALKWYREAVKTPTALTGGVALKAARVARDQLHRESDAEEFLRIACRAGNREACGEARGAIPRGPLRRRNRG
jgi:tetratricopeptide (TPR) repeat protein